MQATAAGTTQGAATVRGASAFLPLGSHASWVQPALSRNSTEHGRHRFFCEKPSSIFAACHCRKRQPHRPSSTRPPDPASCRARHQRGARLAGLRRSRVSTARRGPRVGPAALACHEPELRAEFDRGPRARRGRCAQAGPSCDRCRLAPLLGDVRSACDHAARRGLRTPCRCTDPDDQKFIDLALHSGAQWLLSRDRAVLKLAREARQRGLAIVAPHVWHRCRTTIIHVKKGGRGRPFRVNVEPPHRCRCRDSTPFRRRRRRRPRPLPPSARRQALRPPAAQSHGARRRRSLPWPCAPGGRPCRYPPG